MAILDSHATSSSTSMPHLVPGNRQRALSRDVTARRIVHAQSEDGLLTWSYTAGLREAFHHPEFLITGLDAFLAETVLRQLVGDVASHQVFTETTLERNLLHRLTCAFREVPGAMASVLMPLADQIVDGRALSALQCIYPDQKNRLPWHPGYNNSWQETQPIFNFDSTLTRAEINLLRAAAGIHSSPAQHTLHEVL